MAKALFLVLLNTTMQQINIDWSSDIRWSLSELINDVDCIENYCPKVQSHNGIQDTLKDLARYPKHVGLKKSKEMYIGLANIWLRNIDEMLLKQCEESSDISEHTVCGRCL